MDRRRDDEWRRASARVIEAVARREEISPASLQPPLYEVVDPDALDEMLADAHEGTRIVVEYYGYEVEITRNFVRIRHDAEGEKRSTITAD